MSEALSFPARAGRWGKTQALVLVRQMPFVLCLLLAMGIWQVSLPLPLWRLAAGCALVVLGSSFLSRSHPDKKKKHQGPRLVILESPYAAKGEAEIEANLAYARACLKHSLSLGEAPIASHLLYTQPGVLRDEIPAERQQGIDAGLSWRSVAQASVVYTDRGISQGMRHGIAVAEEQGIPVEYRRLSRKI